MKAGEILINGIFNGSRLLEVPFYQRSYVWGEEQWDRFLEDMEFVTKTKKPYFLGSIIFKSGKAPNTWDTYSDCKIVIDGQQRLTTLIIFFKVLCLKMNENKLFEKDFRLEDDTIVLRHGRNDASAFELVMSQEKPEEIPNTVPASQVIGAFNYFVKHLKPELLHRNIIKQNVQFVCIDLLDGEDEQQVFDTINSLGVRLTTAELLKNYFYNKDNVQEYEKNWAAVFEKDGDARMYWDQELETGRIKRSLIDIFFDAYFQLFIQDKRYSVSAEDKAVYSRVDHLSKSYQEFINNYCGGDKSVVLAPMAEYAKCFAENFKPEYCDMSMPASFGIERINVIMFGLKTTTLIPYVLYVAKNVVSKAERDEIYGVLESYIMRRLIVHATTKNYNNLFTSLILNQVLDAQTLKERLYKGGDATTYVPSNDDLMKGFYNSKLINAQAKGILYFIEAGARTAKNATVLLGFNGYSLEHLMPKKWRNNWEKCETPELARQRDSVLLTLGNLAIITQSLNASIRDSDWQTKKAGKGQDNPGLLSCAAGLTTIQDALKKDIWNEAEIRNRAVWLCEQAKNLWKFYDEEPINDAQGENNKDDEKQVKPFHRLRRQFWSYALPVIRQSNENKVFSNVNPGKVNWINGFFGINGFSLSCVACFDSARVDLYMGNADAEKNKKAFDLLIAHKAAIESQCGVQLDWSRGENIKSSKVSYQLKNVSIENEADWPKMTEFLAEWSKKFYDVMARILLSNQG